jgi:hypothetical protein
MQEAINRYLSVHFTRIWVMHMIKYPAFNPYMLKIHASEPILTG